MRRLRNWEVGGETSDVRGGFRKRNGFRERLGTESKGVKWLGTGVAFPGGRSARGQSGRKRSAFNGCGCKRSAFNGSGRKRATSNQSGRCFLRLDALDAALAPPNKMCRADAPRTEVYVISAWNV